MGFELTGGLETGRGLIDRFPRSVATSCTGSSLWDAPLVWSTALSGGERVWSSAEASWR